MTTTSPRACVFRPAGGAAALFASLSASSTWTAVQFRHIIMCVSDYYRHASSRGRVAGVTRAWRGRDKLWQHQKNQVQITLVTDELQKSYLPLNRSEFRQESSHGHVTRVFTCRNVIYTWFYSYRTHWATKSLKKNYRNTDKGYLLLMFMFYCTCLWINSIYVVLIVNGHQFAK